MKIFNLKLTTSDFLVFTFLLLLTVFEIIFQLSIRNWQKLVLGNIGVLLISFLALWGLSKISSAKLQAFLRICGYMLMMSFIYRQMGNLIHAIFPQWFDSWIVNFELAIFGYYPNLRLEALASPWLNEFMNFGYVIYAPLLPAIAYLSYLKQQKNGLERYLTAWALANFLCYIFYVLIPVAGPSRAFQYSIPLSGYFFTAVAEYLKGNVHLIGGAFPSAHCAAATVMLAESYRVERRIFYALFPVVLLIYISTVYGRFHYVLDVVAGIFIAALSLWLAPGLEEAFKRLTLQFELTLNRIRQVSLAKRNLTAGEDLDLTP